MNDMTQTSRYRIRKLTPGGLRPSTLPFGHGGYPQYLIFTSEHAGKKHFVSLKHKGQSGVRARDLRLSRQVALTTAPGPPPLTVR